MRHAQVVYGSSASTMGSPLVEDFRQVGVLTNDSWVEVEEVESPSDTRDDSEIEVKEKSTQG